MAATARDDAQEDIDYDELRKEFAAMKERHPDDERVAALHQVFKEVAE